MKRYINTYFVGTLLFAFSLLLFTACEVEQVIDPNNPSLEGVLNDATPNEIQSLTTGLEAYHRGYFGNATQLFGCFGREVWAYFGSDPRFQQDWLGTQITETYPDFFASGGTYVTPYTAIRHANTLIQAAQGSSALTPEELSGVEGFAKTIKAYQYIWPLMQQYQNGIRFEVDQPLNPGPFLSYEDALGEIRGLIDEANQDLADAGSSFVFDLSDGFTGFDTPSGMQQVNRAIAARLALYAEDYQGALTALNNSFMDLNVDAASSAKMNIGPAHVYGEAPDINNPLFYPFDQPTNTILIVHPAMIEDALPGDARLSKFAERVNNPVQNSGIQDENGNQIPGRYQDARWATNISPIPFIRNEELILIYAEANARTGNTAEAVNAINTVRNTWGVGDYAGTQDEESLMEEILFQRRYSLWAEAGHRWIDLRRTNRLNDNYVDLRDTGNIFTQVARRTSETNWENR